jgi:excisionase family DNA binding protein
MTAEQRIAALEARVEELERRLAGAPQGVLTVREVATHFRISRRTVEKLVEAGQIRGTRIGKSIRIAAADVPGYAAPFEAAAPAFGRRYVHG